MLVRFQFFVHPTSLCRKHFVELRMDHARANAAECVPDYAPFNDVRCPIDSIFAVLHQHMQAVAADAGAVHQDVDASDPI